MGYLFIFFQPQLQYELNEILEHLTYGNYLPIYKTNKLHLLQQVTSIVFFPEYSMSYLNCSLATVSKT